MRTSPMEQASPSRYSDPMVPRQRKRRGLRAEIAHLGARMLSEGTAGSFEAAKRKASAQLGIRNTADYPDNLELQQALLEYQRVFEGDEHAIRQRHLRQQALTAMRFLSSFTARLAGPVLYGTACADTPITLHVFSDEAEAVARFLIDGGMHFGQDERRLRTAGGESRLFPVFYFCVDGTDFEVIVFPSSQAGLQPLSPLDGKPMRRAGISKLESLLAETKT